MSGTAGAGGGSKADHEASRELELTSHRRMATVVLMDLVAATNPMRLLGGLTMRGWVGVALGAILVYLRQASTLARESRDMPCPRYGVVFRILYGLFGTWFAEVVLGRMLHTPEGEPQPTQKGGTKQTVVGPPELRVKLIPNLVQDPSH